MNGDGEVELGKEGRTKASLMRRIEDEVKAGGGNSCNKHLEGNVAPATAKGTFED